MNKGCRHQLDNRKNADIEYHLLYQIAVFKQCAGSIGDGFRKIKPGNKPCRKVEHIGHLHTAGQHLCLCIKHLIKHKPVHNNCYHRLHQRPHKSKIRARISLFKIIFRKLPNQFPAVIQFPGNNKHPVVIQPKNNTGQYKKGTGTVFL